MSERKKEDMQARAKKIWKKNRENTWFARFSRKKIERQKDLKNNRENTWLARFSRE